MIKYNWSAIRYHTKNDIKKILLYFYKIYNNNLTDIQEYLVDNKYALRILDESKLNKYNYIINLNDFLENSMNATPEEMYVYLDLASKRDYFTYLNTKKKVNYLPIWKVVDYDINKLKTNRLLNIDENNIYFVYEGDT
jgi:hypothetical protein